MNKFRNIMLSALSLTFVCAAATTLSSCQPVENNVFTIERSMTTVEEIPEDAVNYVMFAYGENPAIDFQTTLTLDRENNTYTLYKLMETPETEMDGQMTTVFRGQYEYTGSYTTSSSDSNSITLSVPTSGRYNCYYPTVLNYQSIEKQTQDWVSSTDYPTLLTRFNKWYPAKNETTVPQPVTLSGNTMTFGEVNTSLPEQDSSSSAPDSSSSSSVDESTTVEESIADPEAIISAVADGNKVIDLYADGSYKFRYPQYTIEEPGTWTWANYTLTLTRTSDSAEFVASFNESYNLALEYTSAASEHIKGSFVFEDWGDALGTSGNYTPAE